MGYVTAGMFHVKHSSAHRSQWCEIARDTNRGSKTAGGGNAYQLLPLPAARLRRVTSLGDCKMFHVKHSAHYTTL